MQLRLDQNPDIMAVRRETVEHPFSTIRAWMGATRFLTKFRNRVGTEVILHVLAYNLKRLINIIGIRPLIQAMQAAKARATANLRPRRIRSPPRNAISGS